MTYSLLETEQVALDNMVTWTLKLYDQTFLVPYSTENRSTFLPTTSQHAWRINVSNKRCCDCEWSVGLKLVKTYIAARENLKLVN